MEEGDKYAVKPWSFAREYMLARSLIAEVQILCLKVTENRQNLTCLVIQWKFDALLPLLKSSGEPNLG